MEKDQLFYLENRKQVMIMYLNMKVGEEDWHGVADAAKEELKAQLLAQYDAQQSQESALEAAIRDLLQPSEPPTE